jgi:hypothetical protein
MARPTVTAEQKRTRQPHLEGAVRFLADLAGAVTSRATLFAWCSCTDGTHPRPAPAHMRPPGAGVHRVVRRSITVQLGWVEE